MSLSQFNLIILLVVIYFNNESVHEIPPSYSKLRLPLKFKLFHRHLNQRTPTEFGLGSICISDAVHSEHLSVTQRLAIVNKGIKVGELKVTLELGCDRIHFGKEFVGEILFFFFTLKQFF